MLKPSRDPRPVAMLNARFGKEDFEMYLTGSTLKCLFIEILTKFA